MLNRRRLVAAMALAPLAVPAAAAVWPQRPVRIVFPYAAGSSGDLAARLIAGRLSAIFGQPFMVENRLGANGTIAAEVVAHSPADGDTLLCGLTPQLAISPWLMKVPYDPLKDLIPISAISTTRFALIVNTQVPARTVGEFIEYVRAQRKQFAYAAGGTGSVGHLAMVLLLDRAGLSGTSVSYKGNEPALADVVGGHLPAMFSLLGDALPHAASGAIRLLAVSSAQRSPLAPDLPTVAELGYPGFDATAWLGLLAPAGTPRSIVDRVATEVVRATKDPAIVAHFAKFGIDPLGSTPAGFAAMIAADSKTWRRALEIAGLKPR